MSCGRPGRGDSLLQWGLRSPFGGSIGGAIHALLSIKLGAPAMNFAIAGSFDPIWIAHERIEVIFPLFSRWAV